ncbi:prolipoprotein diacylglyceryl transferase [Candidatus Curtissbacteria bacterium RIFCSPHIGHO2_02_FULL_40_17]|uniref:Phosphatidylglycerol--prolipoprotein diacylglyceryl transferase n=4 Tax=Candidatus Curtissiibacteriota TaxID=1752717 RepID=A0A1F5GHF7_9BACT|nr:MAG: prolipoprotein diacylglyceryl transferase [Candidatus Curtissbacteria bacterium RIFCSPHIGHO2_01_FULL_40_12]OGD91285.1 MAG: prolipoprotein diacylglyceryl transferase [Candidatus Curtissbacteria bacterium RIFCSPHIGHO2_02_FULL_40_17]OGE04909.1 MAG: prolipoprotein diacylglyceryl transferase [Candidatus Curtissbacteria bacterium RIFCSPHIGHO2_12_FULL_41_17]OGE08374.1 MAG: prolipoprotein diacylglyceryl transferase [Candidatus Curtissbacteria bacterium RIFCSPLOWO2_02_FULL_40_13b]
MIPAQISIGPIKFHLYGAIIAVAILVGWYLAKKRAHLFKIPQKIFDDPILLLPLFFSLVGARLYHVFDYWNYYSQNLISIIYVWGGGLGIWGGIAGAVFGFFLVAKIKRIDFLSVLDLAAPSLLLGQAIGRIANFINQEGFGPPTDLPWGVYISPDRRPDQFTSFSYFHPTFFYEAILNTFFFTILLVVSRKLKIKGQIFSLYLVFYSISRFITEFWRIDTATIDTVKVAQVISIIVLTIGLGLFIHFRQKGT